MFNRRLSSDADGFWHAELQDEPVVSISFPFRWAEAKHVAEWMWIWMWNNALGCSVPSGCLRSVAQARTQPCMCRLPSDSQHHRADPHGDKSPSNRSYRPWVAISWSVYWQLCWYVTILWSFSRLVSRRPFLLANAQCWPNWWIILNNEWMVMFRCLLRTFILGTWLMEIIHYQNAGQSRIISCKCQQNLQPYCTMTSTNPNLVFGPTVAPTG